MTSDPSTAALFSPGARPDRHAVVLGAGVAGLLAARVLAESYDRVTVVDRDVLAGGDRRGVPQGQHLHALMDRGRQVVEDLHPGFVAELVARGAPTCEALVGSRWYLRGRRVGPVSTGLVSVLASRSLLENLLRGRTAALPGVRLLPQTTVSGLVTTESRSVVTGVRVRPVAGPGTPSQVVLPAELVVDATGRGSRAVEWLAALGHPPPPCTRLDVDLGYCSRFYRRRAEHLDGHLSVIVSTTPGSPGGGAVAVEDDRWIVTLAGMRGDHPPADPDGFEAFAARLPVPDVHELLRSAVPLTDPVPYRFRGSARHHFEALRRPPEGFVVLGDALCSFNPLYAQGMTVAAQQAVVLRDCLRTGRPRLARRFYREAAAVVDVAWDLAASADLRYPGVAGRRVPRLRLAGSYAHRAQAAAHHDPVVARALLRVVNLIDPPTALLRPQTAVRVLRHGRDRARDR